VSVNNIQLHSPESGTNYIWQKCRQQTNKIKHKILWEFQTFSGGNLSLANGKYLQTTDAQLGNTLQINFAFNFL